MIQYKYNGSHNDEWYLEPVKKSNSYGIKYARKNATISPFTSAYPDLSSMGGDCTNFVSQCMVASGIHYRNSWYVYKKIINICILTIHPKTLVYLIIIN